MAVSVLIIKETEADMFTKSWFWSLFTSLLLLRTIHSSTISKRSNNDDFPRKFTMIRQDYPNPNARILHICLLVNVTQMFSYYDLLMLHVI